MKKYLYVKYEIIHDNGSWRKEQSLYTVLPNGLMPVECGECDADSVMVTAYDEVESCEDIESIDNAMHHQNLMDKLFNNTQNTYKQNAIHR